MLHVLPGLAGPAQADQDAGQPPVQLRLVPAGLDEPGQNTAITLTQITFALLGPRWPLDDLVMLKAISGLQDKAVRAFVSTGRRLEREEKTQK